MDNVITSTEKAVPSPCIGLCSVGLGDAVCRGCKRFDPEVKNWNTVYTAPQKLAVESRLSTLMQKAVKDKALVRDESLLRRCLDAGGAPYPKHRDALCLIWDMLRMGGSSINFSGDFGFEVRQPYAHLSPVALRTLVDDRFYALSVAYYQRYIGRAYYADAEAVASRWREKGTTPRS